MKRRPQGGSETDRLVREFDRVEDGLSTHLAAVRPSAAPGLLTEQAYVRQEIKAWYGAAAQRGLYDEEALRVSELAIADMDRDELAEMIARLVRRVKEAATSSAA